MRPLVDESDIRVSRKRRDVAVVQIASLILLPLDPVSIYPALNDPSRKSLHVLKGLAPGRQACCPRRDFRLSAEDNQPCHIAKRCRVLNLRRGDV